jgi:tRNA U34 5-methylaminomethyl-2-thiouridine-forming methyltransferase MnmC
LEIGLGSGLNAFMTWIEAEKRNLRVQYTAIEAYPVDLPEVLALHYPDALRVSDRGADFERLHTCAWEIPLPFSEHFMFEKKRCHAEAFAETARFDLIYFDAFAPQAQPELWTAAVLGAMYASLHPEGALVTYCAKGEVKRTLKKVGFKVETLKGPPGKREMTRAVKL